MSRFIVERIFSETHDLDFLQPRYFFFFSNLPTLSLAGAILRCLILSIPLLNAIYHQFPSDSEGMGVARPLNTKLTPEHYRQHRQRLVEHGIVKKSHAPSTKNNIDGLKKKWTK